VLIKTRHRVGAEDLKTAVKSGADRDSRSEVRVGPDIDRLDASADGCGARPTFGWV